MIIYNKLNNEVLLDAKKNSKGIYDLRGANLKDADLAGSNLTRADLTLAKLLDAKLAGANLAGVSLVSANLAGADLEGVNLKCANLIGVNLDGAKLKSIYGFSYAKIQFNGMGEMGREMIYFKNPKDDNMYFQCGCFFGDEASLLKYIADGRDEYKQTRLHALNCLKYIYDNK